MKILIILFLFVLGGCGTIKINDFKNTVPVFKIEEYFLGSSVGKGIVLDRSGNPIKQFTVFLNGTLKDDTTFILNEDFEYSSGEKQNRIWTVKLLENNRYQGYASDVVNFAEGHSEGQALNWHYTLLVPVDGKPMELQFNDWMFLQNDKKTLINKATMTKFGIYAGEVLIFFTKEG